MDDTSPSAAARYRELLLGLSREERLARALALSALVRNLTWAGASRTAGDRGAAAVLERYLVQLYGSETASRVGSLLARHSDVDHGG